MLLWRHEILAGVVVYALPHYSERCRKESDIVKNNWGISSDLFASPIESQTVFFTATNWRTASWYLCLPLSSYHPEQSLCYVYQTHTISTTIVTTGTYNHNHNIHVYTHSVLYGYAISSYRRSPLMFECLSVLMIVHYYLSLKQIHSHVAYT